MEASAVRAPAGLGRLALPFALLKLRSDEQLVAMFRAGNDEAFRVIHDRYRQRLLAYVRQMLAGSRSDAEDALQDVFLRAYNALRLDDRPVALKAWLYRVAHNRCIDQLRRPVPAPADVFDTTRPVMPDPLAESERRDDLRRLVSDVQALPDQQRSALLMRELEGLSYANLAAALDVTVPAVKSLLVRARIGLVEAAEARDTACADIQGDLALSFGKGVRASAKARRHMRDCPGCRAYRSELRGVQSGLAALLPGPGPLGLVAKIFGMGAGAGGGGAAVIGGGGAAAGATAKVAALVCCAAVVGGGAVELRSAPAGGAEERTKRPAAAQRDAPRAAPERALAPAPASLPAPARAVRTASARPKAATQAAARRRSAARPAEEPISSQVSPAPGGAPIGKPAVPPTGGAVAPADPDASLPVTPVASATQPGTGTGGSVTASSGDAGETTTATTTSTAPTATTASSGTTTQGSGDSSGTTTTSGTSTTSPR